MEVLGGLLLADFGTAFVATYSPGMQGGALRVTAQDLRRIPDRETLPPRRRRGAAGGVPGGGCGPGDGRRVASVRRPAAVLTTPS